MHRHTYRRGELQSIHDLAGAFSDSDDLLKRFDIVASRGNSQRERGEPLRCPIKRAGHFDLDTADLELASANRGKKMACKTAAQCDQLLFAPDRSPIGATLVRRSIDKNRVRTHAGSRSCRPHLL
jgi:hypothetical protein